MRLPRALRSRAPVEVSSLAAAAFVLGAGCLAFAVFPMAANVPVEFMTSMGVTGVLAALALMVAGPRVTPIRLHAGVVLLTTMLGAMVQTAVTERGLMLSALGFTWVAVYVAFFFRPAAARAHAALMIVVLGLAMLAARAPTSVIVWIILSAMVWIAVSILGRLTARLHAAAHTDGLTGALNRTGFAAAAARQRRVARRRGERLALAVIDLDDFKAVNDRDGHAAGDRLLVELADTWSASLRPDDLLARFGGDEFVLLVSGAGEGHADRLLDRLARVHPAPWTAGTVEMSHEESLDDAIHRADERLYAAKAARAAPARVQPARITTLQPGRA